MKNNKFGLYLIILLLIVVIPSTIYSIYYNNLLEKEFGNPKHLAKIDNRLYFYSELDELIGYYDCTNADCEEATPTVDDQENFEVTFTGSNKVGVINRQAFIDDGGIKLVSFGQGENKSGSVIGDNIVFVKNYDGMLASYIIYGTKNDDVISYYLKDTTTGALVLSDYEFIGINRAYDQDLFIIKKDGMYAIANTNEIYTLAATTDEIVDYTGTLLMIKSENGTITIKSRDGKDTKLAGVKKYHADDNMVVVQTSDGSYVYDTNMGAKLDSKMGNDITFKVENGLVTYIENDKPVGTWSYAEYESNQNSEETNIEETNIEETNIEESLNTETEEPVLEENEENNETASEENGTGDV